MKRGHIDLISLGCSKNLVDSERLLRRIAERGWSFAHDPSEVCGEYVMVNTCGFIGDAKEESINMLLQLAEKKKEGAIGKLAVMGCLSERYREELKREIPEIDLWYGKFDWTNFIADLPDLSQTHNPEPKPWERELTGNPWSAYLKISEGCNRFCAFCAIPLITGRHTSRPQQEILDEVNELVAKGVKEFNVIAQDLSSYGTDLHDGTSLATLVEAMAQTPGVEWIRLHYAYPTEFPYDVLPVMRRYPNVCSYIDIALQHISDNMLTAMRRKISKEETLQLIRRLREEVPDIKIRTTLMVGFPGETEQDFQELKEFVREMRFDRMGAFAYSEEEGTYGAIHYKDDVPPEVKQRRLDEIMELQAEIAEQLNSEMVGRKIKVLAERREGRYVVGRSQWDSPEVDQEIYIADCQAKPGEMTEVEITDSSEYELYAKPV